MLGPLCVGMAVFGVDEWSPGEPAPDLWQRFGPAVSRSLREAKLGGGVPIADSKRIKLSNQSKTRHPLTHLERGVLSMLAAASQEHALPVSDMELFERLGTNAPGSEWFQGDGIQLPLANDTGLLKIDAGRIEVGMSGAGVRLLGLFVRLVDERDFNAMLDNSRSKASIIESMLGEQIQQARSIVRPEDTLRLVADRQGARTMYGGLLSRCFEHVEPLEESQRASRYTVDGRHGVILHSEAEDAHFPVALASMAAKLVRELCMIRFNRYWSAKMPELKSTAGYVQDARRWLRDAEPILSESDRRALVRRA